MKQNNPRQIRNMLTQSVRRKNREEMFASNRIEYITVEPVNRCTNSINQKESIHHRQIMEKVQQFNDILFSRSNFEQLMIATRSKDIIQKHYGIIGIKKLLFIQNFVTKSLDPKKLIQILLEYSKQSEYPQLQYQSILALCNYTSGTIIQCQEVVENGGIPIFLNILKSYETRIVRQIILVINNMAYASDQIKNLFIDAGCIKALIQISRTAYNNVSVLKLWCQVLCCVCRKYSNRNYEKMPEAISALCKAIASGRLRDKQMLAQCIQAIANYTMVRMDSASLIIDSEVVPHLLPNLQEGSPLLIYSLQIIGNIAVAEEDNWKYLVSSGIMHVFLKHLNNSVRQVRLSTCKALVNISRQKRGALQILHFYSMWEILIIILQTETDQFKCLICCILANLGRFGLSQKLLKVINEKEIPSYLINLSSRCHSSIYTEIRKIEDILFCLNVLLVQGQKFKSGSCNLFAIQVQNTKKHQILQKLKFHKSDVVLDYANKILHILKQYDS